MEISYFSNSIKIRGKRALFVIDPTGKNENTHGVIFLKSNPSYEFDDVPVISGQGEYEISGVKITGIAFEEQTIYSMGIDGLDILLTDSASLSKLHSKLKEHHIIIVSDGISFDSSWAMALSPRVIVVYGAGGKDLAEKLSKEAISITSKYTTTLEKLPTELEVVLLG